MLKRIVFVTAIIWTIALSGCASNAETSQMIINTSHATKPKDRALIHNISLESITGGHETNALWLSQINNANFKLALEHSLFQANLLGGQHANYSLSAQLIQLDQPFAGLNFKVFCKIHYQLKSKHTKKLILDEDIETSYTATFNDSPLGVVRLKMANEGAAKANIQKLIETIYHLSTK